MVSDSDHHGASQNVVPYMGSTHGRLILFRFCTSLAFMFVFSVIKDLQSLYDYSRGSAFF
ncbi:hypothetical protein PAECIP111894_02453 [Paenibacillus pseudetheri]|uniref:CASP-like protein n=1 Tax=Paenibacillus pseudetheri TaxID=2897682 RepID=A0ABM9BCK3_9BACL|nr:hypothetical protein PAECIP111894_02453 [Paenibacillus pseudetheri]